MKKSLLIVLSSCLYLISQAQTLDLVDIRNFRSSAVISIQQNMYAYRQLDDYGKLMQIQNETSYSTRFLFMGQEFDQYLKIYFFPSRIYSSANKRFFQPDPKSQFQSPFLFVASDPINNIDIDGNISKPLILHFENQYDNLKEDASLLDFKAQVTDAYYVPISDFLNDKTIDLKDWNGEVFIKGHMGATLGAEIGVERALDPSAIKTSSSVANPMFEREGKFMVDVDAKKFGEHLRTFAENRGVTVHSIVAGGCQGQDAAERVARGYIGSRTGTGKQLYAAGLKRGNNAYVAGKIETSLRGKQDVLPLEKTRFHVKPKGASTSRSLTKDSKGRKLFSKYRGKLGNNPTFDYKYAEGDELYDLVGGRLPASISDEFEEFFLKY